MNLHEECLLKYLLNPIDLFNSTELLKLHNSLIAEGAISYKKIINQTEQMNYNASKI